MITKIAIPGIFLLTLLLGLPAFAQSDMNNMLGMAKGSMQGMNMGQMDRQCAQMQTQMQPGMHMSADMQKMIDQCDQMQKDMGASAQPPGDTLSR